MIIQILEYVKINDNTIKSINNEYSPYNCFNSLMSRKLEMLNAYIKTSLVNYFISLSKFNVKAPIFFIKKLDRS